MKIAAITGAVVATLAAGAIAAPTVAQPYGYARHDTCQHKKHKNGTTGAIIGGLAGAAIGNGVASGGGRTGGTIIGGVAGAAVGNSIGRSSAKNSDDCDYYQNSYYRDGRSYERSRSAYDNGYNSSYYDGVRRDAYGNPY